jgi:PAS domain S-box-containing protein
MASAGRSSRELIKAAMKKMKGAPRASKKFSPGGANGAQSNQNGAKIALKPSSVQYPKTGLEAAIQRYVDLFDLAPIGYVSFDRIGRIEDINLAATQLVGRARRYLLGRPFASCVAKPDLQLFLHHLLHCRSSQGPVETQLHLKGPSGKAILVQLSSMPTDSLMKDGAMLYQTVIVDLTERNQAEEALRESEERYRAIVSQSIVGMVRADLEGRFIFVNQKFCEMLGCNEAELVGKTIRSITHPDDRAQSMKLFRRLSVEGKPYELEKRFLRKDGSILWASVSASPVRDAAGKVQSAGAVIIDIGDRRKAQAQLEDATSYLEFRVREQTRELQAANQELKKEIKQRKGLEGQILEVSDREQQRLGTELHDGLCQHLTAIAFMVRATALRLKNHRVIDPTDIEKIAELVNGAANDARNLARALHHVDVDSSDLVPALEDLVDREIWKTPCRLEIAPGFHIENDAAAAHLYRIAREAVINANKHAQAREIVVNLDRSRKGITLSISDNGVGIPAGMNPSAGMGFHIMNQRAKSIGGRLEIASRKHTGTRVTCHLPKRK